MLRCAAPLRHESRKCAAGWIILIGLLFAAPSLDDGLISDDYDLIAEGRIAAPRDVARALTTPGMQGFYRPLPRLLLGAQWAMHRLAPFGYHAVDAAVHIAAALVLFRIVLAVTGAFPLGVLAGVLFAGHFVHVEPVYWVSARNEPLSALGYLLAVMWALRPGRRYRAASLVAFGVALLSKETAVTFPLVAMAMAAERTAGSRHDRGRAALRAGALPFLILAGYALLRWHAGAAWPWTSREVGFTGRPLLMLSHLEQYAVQLTIPVRTILDVYGSDTYGAVTGVVRSGHSVGMDATLALGAVLLALGVKAAFTLGGRAARLGMAFAALTILPFLFMEGTGVRYLYLPSAGFALTAAGVIAGGAVRWNRGRCVETLQVATAVFVLLSLAVAGMQARWWDRAGVECRRVIGTVSGYAAAAPEDAPLYVFGLPRRLHGAYVFHNGFDAAMRLRNPDAGRRILDGDRARERGEAIPADALILRYRTE